MKLSRDHHRLVCQRARPLRPEIAAADRGCGMRSGVHTTKCPLTMGPQPDRKSTRLNSSHLVISYAVFCLKKKKKKIGIGGVGLLKMKLVSATQRTRELGRINIMLATRPSLFPQSVGEKSLFFFFNDTATTEIYTLSLHDALPI